MSIGAAAWYALAGPGRAGGAPGSVIGEFSGTDDQTTPSFLARRGWQIQWESEGDQFEYAIRGDVDIGTVVDQGGPGSGITSPVPSGNFRLEVRASGPWTIRVTQGD